MVSWEQKMRLIALDPVPMAILAAVQLITNELQTESESELESESEAARRRVARQEEARQFANSILVKGSDNHFRDLFGIDKATFKELCSYLRARSSLRDGEAMSLDHMVMVYLWLSANKESQEAAARYFQLTRTSVSRAHKSVLSAMRELPSSS
ncbi:hypothetical protein EDB81DRAFT_804952 [Dactylonectria macrodidyma]|uniref:DUF8040 domain-containing protein n=1 Tax=Dactylonectria macrodidyma TaxID=307937 RepID=A0A9P9EAQ7_9HYPO|nr:hypothetical protein EDB81DRAFT_804952 [Dactylonectria macrodidyma]